ncbi:Phosphoadenosine phosphosulfate reductase family protein [Pedobacter terrae]|uniref:Phosphoadenosine phosphosulfate reductase family protein n=1 Tax=Pedobacter terrae TaxID=405671 RepID=A0A1G7TBH2_9SPHI|nr:phosphoadenosine phosphosulfate reductase family protein [Pedobacter terrae]SDG31940.1 Phosphoadenosine phosphosulfate reductase family protein [Pedobacter terrae]
MKRVFNFSGGATSALMTILGKPTPDDIVLFTDTKWESPETYKFIDEFELYEGIKVHRVAYTHRKSPGMEGFPAYLNHKVYLPNRERRICTEDLKVRTAKRYLRTLGVRKFENLIGFRFDEKHRVDRNQKRFVNVFNKFPLYDMGVTKEMVDQYWLTKPYRLQIPRILGNCDLCFLKGKNAIITILQHHPELASKWIDAENNNHKKGHSATFIKGISYKEMLHIANSQRTLFDIDLAEPAFSCSCSNT